MNGVRLIAATLVAILLSGSVAFADESLTQPAEGVYRYAPGDGYISMFVVTNDGVIAIEPVNTTHATGLLKAIRSVTDKQVVYLLHSHNHWDHSGGGQVFRDVGATIVAHAEAYEWMQANPHPDMVLPSESWIGKRRDIKLGGTTVELYYMGLSHGYGMTVFRLPKEKLVYIADLVTPNRVLFSIVPDFNIPGLLNSLRQIEAMDFERAIFSHSQTREPFGSKADVILMREYVEDLQGAIKNEFKKGTSWMEVPFAVKLPKYKHWAMYDEWLPLNVWRIMLDMHMGPFPWRPRYVE